MGLFSVVNIRPKRNSAAVCTQSINAMVFGRWQQRCGRSLSVQQQLVATRGDAKSQKLEWRIVMPLTFILIITSSSIPHSFILS